MTRREGLDDRFHARERGHRPRDGGRGGGAGVNRAREAFDAAVIGGGVMGCATALWLNRGGMKVAVFERDRLCRQASGRNAGTLTLMYTRASLVPYTARGREMWATTGTWLGEDCHFRDRVGLELAFTPEDAEVMETQMRARADAGAPIEIVGGNRAREIEPALSDAPVMAAYCPVDGSANSTICGHIFRRALVREGVHVRENARVESVQRDGDAFALRVAGGIVRARRVVLSGGAWIGKMAAWFGLDFPVTVRINQGTILERLPFIFNTSLRVMGHISLKQLPVGSVLVGGGKGEHWIEDPDQAEAQQNPSVIATKMANAVNAAVRAVPALRHGRIARTWVGPEGFAPDNLPIVGPLPGVKDAFVVGCQRSGFTTGPFMGMLLAQHMLGGEPEMPIVRPEFDPGRLAGMRPQAWETDPQSA